MEATPWEHCIVGCCPPLHSSTTTIRDKYYSTMQLRQQQQRIIPRRCLAMVVVGWCATTHVTAFSSILQPHSAVQWRTRRRSSVQLAAAFATDTYLNTLSDFTLASSSEEEFLESLSQLVADTSWICLLYTSPSPRD